MILQGHGDTSTGTICWPLMTVADYEGAAELLSDLETTHPFGRAWWCLHHTATATRWCWQNKSCKGAYSKPQFGCNLLPNSPVPSVADWYRCRRNPIDSHWFCNIRLYKSYSEINLIENLLGCWKKVIYLSFAQDIHLKTKRYSADRAYCCDWGH